jgi:hypothetical protein
MTRILQPELLDELPSTDPRAIHSRRDLRRINALMGDARAITAFVRDYARTRGAASPMTIAEIGCGEGLSAAQLARVLSTNGYSGKLLLVDRQPSDTTNRIPNWSADVITADVFDWVAGASKVDVIIANLFLHHFSDEQLRELLGGCERLCDCFAAAEPRRSSLAAWFSRRVRLIGCNEVTQHDAEISVRAGFRDSEISALWPRRSEWQLVEKRSGLFTHFFGATRGA